MIQVIRKKALAAAALVPAMAAGGVLAGESPAGADVDCAAGTNAGVGAVQTGATRRDATSRGYQTFEFQHAGSACPFLLPDDMFIRVNHCNLGSPTDGANFTRYGVATIGYKPESNNCFVLQWKALVPGSAGKNFSGRLIW